MNWLNDICDNWRTAVASDRLPHAVLLVGPPGVGKRALANWMAHGKVTGSLQTKPTFPVRTIEHADFHGLSILEGKSTIGVDQVRALITDMTLTTYSGHGKVALIEPAQKMTSSAANGLLKTLEEPSGDALLILIADRAGRLPATIFSRCQTIKIATPSEPASLEFLESVSPGRQWIQALHAAHGAPMYALELIDRLDELDAMHIALDGILGGTVDPIAIAAKWAKLDAQFVLDWLASEIQLATKLLAAGEKWAQGLGLNRNQLQRMDTRKLFCYLDIINRLRASAKGSFNVQLAFERLLLELADGMQGLTWTPTPQGLDYIRPAETSR